MFIDHIQLACPVGGEQKAREFFVGLLGMIEEPKPEPLRARGGCWFRKEKLVLHIGIDKKFAPQTKAHPAFCVSNVDDLAESLERKGHAVEWDTKLPGVRRFYTRDPFGNRIEFIREGDGFR